MSVPIRVSQLTQASPVLSGDQVLIARGAGATGESYRALAKDLVSDLLNTASTATLTLSFDKPNRVLYGDVASVPANKGGTGITAYLPGQILIGTSAGGLVANKLTAGPRMVITDASGSITLTPSATNLTTTYAPSSVNIIPSTGAQTIINAATTTTAGVMTDADRIKLDGIEVNANKYIHPSYIWPNTALNSTTVISNLSVNSTGHLTDWATRTLGTMSTQDSNAVNITKGTIEGTNDIKSWNAAKTTMYASIGPDTTSVLGELKLRNSTGTSYSISTSPITMSGSIGAQAGITVTGSNLCVSSNAYIKGVVYAEGGLQYYNSGTGAWVVATSDARAKEVLSSYTQGLSDVISLNPVKFKFKRNLEPFPGDNERVGLIAQEVEKVFPNCVFQTKQKLDDIEQDVYQLDIKDLSFAFINAFKELSEKYNNLEQKYNDLAKKLETCK